MRPASDGSFPYSPLTVSVCVVYTVTRSAVDRRWRCGAGQSDNSLHLHTFDH